ncbi:MAG: hypothetical protein NW241_20165 [Bacteroidia bacterium]|nr:hypothetical protein [Bacteroidia bacterium]
MGISLLHAQSFLPAADRYRWQTVASDHFDVYFHGDPAAADRVARYAEQARHDLGLLFDFKTDTRYTLIYLADAAELMYSNLELQTPERQPGILRMPEFYAYVVHPGSMRGLYQAARHAVASVMLREFGYGDHLSSHLQSRLLLYDAPWFTQGLAEYAAYGWTWEDEMWISSMSGRGLLDPALEGSSPLSRTARRSVWHYIVQEYSEQKIAEILYLVNISHSIESGIISVLGLTLNSLTQRWQAYYRERSTQQAEGRLDLHALGQPLQLPIPGAQVSGMAWSEPARSLALTLVQEGRQSLWLYHPETESFTPAGLRFGLRRPDRDWSDLHTPMSWSGNGRWLALAAIEAGVPQLIRYSADSQQVQRLRLPAGISRVLGLALSPDGSRAVLSALFDDHADLLLLDLEGGSSLRLTEDAWDDLDPAWSLDGERLFFASNRREASSGPEWDSHQHDFDLYSLDPARPEALTRLTATPQAHERRPVALTSYGLLCMSDASGIVNVEKFNFLLRESAGSSNLSQGIRSFDASESWVFLLTPDRGQMELMAVRAADFPVSLRPAPTLMRLEKQAASKRPAAQLPAVVTVPVPAPAAQDSLRQDQPEKPPVRYYIFDDGSEPYEAQPRRPGSLPQPPPRDTRLTQAAFGKAPAPEAGSIGVGQPYRGRIPWRAEYMGIGLFYDPYARTGPWFETAYSDLMHSRRIQISVRPSFNLRYLTSQVRYEYLRGRIDYMAEAGHMVRRIRETGLFNSDSLIFRFDQLRLNGGARYPISSRLAVEAGAGLYYLDRKDQRLLRVDLLNDRDWLAQAGLRLIYRDIRQQEGFRNGGGMARVSWDSYYSLQSRQFAFHRLQAEGRMYVPLWQQIVLAARIAGAVNFSKQAQQYAMGGAEDLLFRPVVFEQDASGFVRSNTPDTTLTNLHFLEFAMPVRGFRPAIRDGSRYILTNFELRIPVSRMSRNALPSRALYGLEFIPFLDAGTVWVDGNPFSQKNPTDTQFITNGPITVKLQTLKSPFLIGFGSGLRTNLLSWSLRMDLAWGIDDYSVLPPMLLFSLGKGF